MNITDLVNVDSGGRADKDVGPADHSGKEIKNTQAVASNQVFSQAAQEASNSLDMLKLKMKIRFLNGVNNRITNPSSGAQDTRSMAPIGSGVDQLNVRHLSAKVRNLDKISAKLSKLHMSPASPHHAAAISPREEDAGFAAAALQMKKQTAQRAAFEASQEQGRVSPKQQKDGIRSSSSNRIQEAFSVENDSIFPLPLNGGMQREDERRAYHLEDSFVSSPLSPAYRSPLVLTIQENGKSPQSRKFFPKSTQEANFDAYVASAAARAQDDHLSPAAKMGKKALEELVQAPFSELDKVIDVVAKIL